MIFLQNAASKRYISEGFSLPFSILALCLLIYAQGDLTFCLAAGFLSGGWQEAEISLLKVSWTQTGAFLLKVLLTTVYWKLLIMYSLTDKHSWVYTNISVIWCSLYKLFHNSINTAQSLWSAVQHLLTSFWHSVPTIKHVFCWVYCICVYDWLRMNSIR